MSWRAAANTGLHGTDGEQQAPAGLPGTAAAAPRSAADLYKPAAPSPGFFLRRTKPVSKDDAEEFLANYVNTRHAVPLTARQRALLKRIAHESGAKNLSDAKRALPSDYQVRLAGAAARCVALLAAARRRPGGLAGDDLRLAQAVASYASLTRNAFVAEVR